MLVLTRKQDEEVVIPHLGITIKVVDVRGQRVAIGVDAPSHIKVQRSEKVADELPRKPHFANAKNSATTPEISVVHQ